MTADVRPPQAERQPPVAPARPRVVAALRTFAGWSGAAVLFAGCLALLGGLVRPPAPREASGWTAGMPPVAALGFALAALSLLLRRDGDATGGRRLAGLLAALLVLAVGLAAGARVMAGREAVLPAPMAPTAAVLFLVTGLALLCLYMPGRGGQGQPHPLFALASQLLFLTVALFTIAALGANLFGEFRPIRSAAYPAMVWPTSLAFVLLSLSGLCAKPESGILRAVTADAVGGDVARRLMPAALLAPPLLCILCYLGYQVGWYGSGFGLAVLTALNSAVMTALVWRTAGALNQTDARRRSSELERMQLNDELQTAHAFLGKVLDSAVFAVLALDLKGRITLANQRMAELSGCPTEELLGQPLAEFLPPAERTAFEQEVLPALREGAGSHRSEAQVVRSDGSRVTVAFGWSGLITEGQAVGFVGTGEDVTERKESEKKLQAHQREIEELNLRLRRAMAETHHRVRNNLQIISALADMQVIRGAATVPVSEVRRIATQVQALAAVHDILTREAKREAGADAIPAAEVLGRLAGLLQRTAGGRAITVHAHGTALSGRQASALAVIANELIVNALKNSAGDVAVRLEAGTGDAAGEAVLTVEDRGPGFPARFDVARDANTGLELVQQVAVWDLQGDVRFANLPTGGARVTVRMPLAQPAAGKPAG
jgi:PAS domain S-box-containing protein